MDRAGLCVFRAEIAGESRAFLHSPGIGGDPEPYACLKGYGDNPGFGPAVEPALEICYKTALRL